MKTKQLTFLGTGTSQGIPIIGCSCEVCLSTDRKDHRLRTSALLKINGKSILFDTSADFRQQMLSNEITAVDAILFTHEHIDHTGGLDELRPLTWLRNAPIPIYAEKRVLDYLQLAFPHIMGMRKYPGGVRISPHRIDDRPFEIDEIGKITPIRIKHFEGLPILGFRIADFAYITDCKTIDASNIEKIKGLDVLVVNALGKKEHPSHLSLKEALDIISIVKPKQAYLTHIGHSMGLYKTVEKELPDSVHLAYDGLNINW